MNTMNVYISAKDRFSEKKILYPTYTLHNADASLTVAIHYFWEQKIQFSPRN